MDKTYKSSDKAKEDTWNIFGFERENIFHQQEHGWPPRNYSCSFCKRQFMSAQGLGGHMNVHRRERARLRNHSPPDSWNVIDSSNPDLDDHKPDLNSNPTPLPLSPEADQCGASTLASSQDVSWTAAPANFSAGSSHHLAKDGDGDVVVANKKNKKSHLSDFGWKSISFAEEGDGGGFEEIIENGKVVLVDGLDSEMGLVVRGPSTSTAIKDLDLELRLGFP